MGLRRISDDFRQSARTLKRIRPLVMTAMLLALQIILGTLTIPVGQSIQITFDYLPACLTAMLFGPVPAFLTGALADLISFVLRPTGAFHPGFMLSPALAGVIYGLFFYRREPVRLWQFIVARLLAAALCNVCLNSLWLLQLYGQTAWAWIPGRVLKNAVELPVSVVLLLAIQRIIVPLRKNILS